MEVITTDTGETYFLPKSLDDVKSFLQGPAPYGVIALDTEATGLNTKKDKLVGISLAFKPKEAIYIPVGHRIGTNIEPHAVIEAIKESMRVLGVFPVMWNGKFDVSMLEFNTGWTPDYYEDVMCSVMLDNPDREEKGLKAVAKQELGFLMAKFEDLFTAEERKARIYDISTKAPMRCVEYASADADATLRLYLHYKHIPEQFSLPYKVDTALVDIIRRVEQHGGMELNIDYINKCLKLLQDREKFLQEMIFRAAGQEFAIGSPKQLGDILFGKLGLPSQGTTKSGNYATGAKELAKLAEQFPIAEWVVSYKKVQKAQGSYFGKLLSLHEKGIPPRFSFNQFAAPTYRLAAPGGDPDVDGKTGVNIQAVSNGEARDLQGVELIMPEAGTSTALSYLEDVDDEDLLFASPSKPKEVALTKLDPADWVKPWILTTEKDQQICILDNCSHCDLNCEAGGLDVTRRQYKGVKIIPSVRQSFRAPKGYVLMGCDYDRQELVIGANLSNEPKWIKALLNNEDLHAITSMAAFNLTQAQWDALPADEKKKKRGIGKILNFATFYGATAHTLSRNTGLPLPVAEQIYNGFVRGHQGLFGWMDKVKLFARRNGYTQTFFGRRRWLKQFYEQNTNAMKAFADRSAVNTAVQGTGADVTRIAMFKCDKWLRDNQVDMDMARLVMSIHDELQFMIREDLLDVIGPRMVDCMQFNVKSWKVQLSVEPKVGQVWGTQKGYKFPVLQ